MSEVFEDRIVAFIDILGTKAILQNAEKNNRLLNLIIDFQKSVMEGTESEISVA